MAEILIVSINREQSPQPVIPAGACALASALQQAGHSVRVLDLCFARHPKDSLQRELSQTAYHFVLFSIRNIDNADLLAPRSYLAGLRSFIEIARKESRAPLILGGPAVSIAPRQILNYLGCRYAIVGEGEEAGPALIEALKGGRAPIGIPGVVIRHNAGFEEAPVSPIPDLSSLMPLRPWRWIDLANYQTMGVPLPIQTKRGCALDCAYCNYGRIEGRCFRLREPEAVADEMAEAIHETGIGRFEFVDSVFNVPQEHAMAVCEAIIRRNLRVSLHTSSLNPSATSAALFRHMRRAGFESFVGSIESASDTVLASLRKGFGSPEIARTMELSRREGLHAVWMLLFGGPSESEKTVHETLGFLEKHLHPPDIALASCGIRIYPGSELESMACAAGILPPYWNPLRACFYLSPDITLEMLCQLLGEYAAHHPNFIFLSDTRHPVAQLLQWGTKRLGLRGPYWKYGMPLARVPGMAALARWHRGDPAAAFGADVRSGRLDGIGASAQA